MDFLAPLPLHLPIPRVLISFSLYLLIIVIFYFVGVLDKIGHCGDTSIVSFFSSLLRHLALISRMVGDDDNSAKARGLAEKAAAKFDSFKYFYAEGGLGERVREFVGISGDATAVAVINVKQQQHFVFAGDLNEAALLAWTESVKAGTAKAYKKSGPRPPNDRDPEHPEVHGPVARAFLTILRLFLSRFISS